MKKAIVDFDRADKIVASKNTRNAIANGPRVALLNSSSVTSTLTFNSKVLQGNISVNLYDANGNLVKAITENEFINNGNFKYNIDKNDLASGIYIIQLQYISEKNNFTETLKLPVL